MEKPTYIWSIHVLDVLEVIFQGDNLLNRVSQISVCFLIIFFGISPVCWSGNSPPVIKDGKIVFHNGAHLKFGEKILFEDPNEALEKGLPVVVISKPIVIPEWERVFLVTKKRYFEGGNTELWIFDFDGNTVAPIMTFWGDISLLKRRERILLGPDNGDSSGFFVVDVNGKLLKRYMVRNKKRAHYLTKFQVSKDENIFWMISYTLSNGEPFSVLELFDFNGNLLMIKEFGEAQEFVFEHEDIKYPIKIPEPQFPG